ncbi:MAG: hypothetical protein K1X67_02060 [Fimbriimonadaceae bacterium]|nr:hypothetical protein [Fimbriimonadaceae bacterium]
MSQFCFRLGSLTIAGLLAGTAGAIGTVTVPPVVTCTPGINSDGPGFIAVDLTYSTDYVIFDRPANEPFVWSLYSVDHWVFAGTTLAVYGSPSLHHRLWGRLGESVRPDSIRFSRNGGPLETAVPYLADGRTAEQRADAPKLDSEDTDIRFWRSPLGWVMTAQGRVSDPGHAIDGQLTLEYSDGINPERHTKSIRVNPDGTFYEPRIPIRLNNQRLADVRPLLIYRRHSGETVNLGYFGNANEITTSTLLMEYLRDSWRNLIGRSPKSTSSRFPETRVLNTMGVKG